MRKSRRIACAIAAAVMATMSLTVASPAANAIPAGTLIRAQGWDTCLHMTSGQFDKFWNGTEFWMYGSYLGGSQGAVVGCTPNSSTAFNHSISIGLATIPFWFGPQPGGSCSTGNWTATISSNIQTAYDQGVATAKNAAAAADDAGYTTGVPIFYDLEGFYNASGCAASARSFLNGWNTWLNEDTPYWGSLYGSECASQLTYMTGAVHVSKSVAPADQVYGTNGATASVYGLQCMSDSIWDQHQRVRQYQDPGGGTPQTSLSRNGSAAIPLDLECADGLVAGTATTTYTVSNCKYIHN